MERAPSLAPQDIERGSQSARGSRRKTARDGLATLFQWMSRTAHRAGRPAARHRLSLDAPRKPDLASPPVRPRVPVIVLSALLVLAVASAMPAAGTAASSCVKLRPTKALKRGLRAAHRRVTSRPFGGPRRGSVYYGRCGPTWYALADFKDFELGYQDQPERFRRRPHHRWKDRGDTGGDVCRAAPRALLRRWGFQRC
jgi:hypothetical protein